ncbi:MAG: DEAD/DEAH box helicase [Actinomycetota bacterium]|nr:DEAD/DEAH box helicase [Actinomycetota bacterium]MDA3027547.1 DEAD/DEAH box helicase [Actinomycetota bacterium]
MTSLRLRPWQRAAFDQFTGSNSPDFLAVATPGAGKTTFALTCALAHLASSPGRLVVVAPTSHLKTQWARAAHRLGLALDIDWAPGQGLARDVHGLVTTYQQVANGSAAERLQGIARDGLVVLDEIHHAGDERAWGSSVLSAFSTASRRLALSGTPFRSDDTPIPFITYETTAEGDLARADVTYGYDDALRDGGVVRPVYFPRFDGQMEWSTPTGDVVRANFADELNRDQVSARLRTALSLDGDWLPQVLTQADQRLRAIRSTDPDAGGLVIATDVDHAHGVARLLRNRLGVHADVVVSDDPSASAKIAAFANDDRPWLISVRMVSEGVDIPRLRVGVYATTVATELFFRQAVGRFVRWQPGRGTQRAYVFIPDDPRLRTHAFRIAESRRHALRPPGRDDDEESFQRGPTEANAVDERPEQLSLFSVVSSTATGMQVHAITEHGLQEFDDDELVPEPAQGDGLEIDLPIVLTEAGRVPFGELSVAERKEDLRTRNAALARRLVDMTGWPHPRVQAEMNRRAGVTSVASATEEQLDRRLRHAESWLRRLRQ